MSKIEEVPTEIEFDELRLLCVGRDWRAIQDGGTTEERFLAGLVNNTHATAVRLRGIHATLLVIAWTGVVCAVLLLVLVLRS